MNSETIEIGKTEISGTPEKVETGAYKDGRGLLRLHFPEHVVNVEMDLRQASDLYRNFGKMLALLQAQTAKKN